MNWSDAIGIYAALLSTGLAVGAWWKARRVVTISLVPAYMDGSHDPPGPSLRASVQNRRKEPVYIRTVFLLVPYRRMTWRERVGHLVRYRTPWNRGEWMTCSLPPRAVCTPALPHHVEAGRALVVWLPVNALRSLAAEYSATSIIVGVQDELDRQFNSRPFAVASL